MEEISHEVHRVFSVYFPSQQKKNTRAANNHTVIYIYIHILHTTMLKYIPQLHIARCPTHIVRIDLAMEITLNIL